MKIEIEYMKREMKQAHAVIEKMKEAGWRITGGHRPGPDPRFITLDKNVNSPRLPEGKE